MNVHHFKKTYPSFWISLGCNYTDKNDLTNRGYLDRKKIAIFLSDIYLNKHKRKGDYYITFATGDLVPSEKVKDFEKVWSYLTETRMLLTEKL